MIYLVLRLMFPKQWKVQASSKTQPKPTGLKGCYTRNDIEIQAENYWRGLETIALYSCLYFEAVKESETSKYSNLTLQCDLTGPVALSFTNFGALQNPNRWELGLQILISCSYLSYVWYTQAIWWYLTWLQKYCTCSGRTSGYGTQVFSGYFWTKMVIEA